MNYPLRVAVKHTHIRKDYIKEEGNTVLLFSIAAHGLSCVIPTKQKSHTARISFSSERCWCDPNKLS